MIDPHTGIEIKLLYHVSFLYYLKGNTVSTMTYSDMCIIRDQYVTSETHIAQVHQAIANYVNSTRKLVPPITQNDVVLLSTPTMIGSKYFKDGKPYDPPIDESI